MSHFIDNGDSCSRDNTPSSIGDYDLEDNFIDDASQQDGSSPPRHSSPQHSPGLFCTPGPEGDRDGSPIRQSIESNQHPFPRLGGTFSSVLPHHARHDQARTVVPVDTRQRTLSELRRSADRQHLHLLRPHLPEGQHRLPSVSVGPVSAVRRSESAASEPVRRGRGQYDRGLPSPSVKRRRQQGEHSSEGDARRKRRANVHPERDQSQVQIPPGQDLRRSVSSSSDDEPLLQRVHRRRLSALFSVTPSEQSDRQHSVGSVASDAVSITSERSSFGRGSPGRSTRATSLASSQGGHSRHQSVQSGTIEELDEEEDDSNPALRFPKLVAERSEEIPGVSLPGIRLGTGKPRWVCRYFLFTFSQSGSDWPWQDFVALIRPIDAKWVISRELHADGGYHFHCFVDFEKKFEFEDEHRFCVGNRGLRPPSPYELKSGRLCPGKVHGNILRVSKTQFHCWDYVKKYGDVLECTMDRPAVKGPNTTRDDNYKASFEAKTKLEFLGSIQDHSPRDFVICGPNIRKTADAIYGKDYQPPETQDNVGMGLKIFWDRYPSARLWFREYFPDPVPVIQATSALGAYTDVMRLEDEAHVRMRGPVKPRPHSLILHGATRLGKTDFARALGAHIYFRGTFNLKKMIKMNISELDYMIWDDVPWSDDALKKEGYKNWLGGQDNFTVTDRYHPKEDVTWGKPCIFLSNRNPLLGLSENDKSWLRGNTTIIDLGEVENHRPAAICESTIHEVVDYAGLSALAELEASMNAAEIQVPCAMQAMAPTQPAFGFGMDMSVC
jgi:hypothetical protein